MLYIEPLSFSFVIRSDANTAGEMSITMAKVPTTVKYCWLRLSLNQYRGSTETLRSWLWFFRLKLLIIAFM